MHEAGAGDICHGCPDLLPGVDHIHAEGVDRITPSEETYVEVYVNDVLCLMPTLIHTPYSKKVTMDVHKFLVVNRFCTHLHLTPMLVLSH